MAANNKTQMVRSHDNGQRPPMTAARRPSFVWLSHNDFQTLMLYTYMHSASLNKAIVD